MENLKNCLSASGNSSHTLEVGVSLPQNLMKGIYYMYIYNGSCPYFYYLAPPPCNSNVIYRFTRPYRPNPTMKNPYINSMPLKDYGPNPLVFNIDEATNQNTNFRTALWTGKHLQVTLMSIPVGGEIGLESHPHLDQFIRIEEGQGIVKMGDKKDYFNFEKRVSDNFAFIIPAGKWHNLINTGATPLKLYSIYAPTQHPHGTIHKTKADADAAERGILR